MTDPAPEEIMPREAMPEEAMPREAMPREAMPEEIMTATAFKAHCLEILDRLSARALRRVTVTKRGRVVAVLMPPAPDAAAVASLHGCMRGSVRLPAAEAIVDRTASWAASPGPLHR